jgi:CRISPR-associated endoribonuclease Cas6
MLLMVVDNYIWGEKMLAELRMELENPLGCQIGYYQSSNLQGVLMEQIDSDYAQFLHTQSLNPYSQSVTLENGKTIWSVKTLNENSYQNIIIPLKKETFNRFTIAKKDISVKILDKKLTVQSKKELLEEFYNIPSDKNINIEFITPTAFKSNGRYVIMPDLRLIFQSLMNKYSASSDNGLEMFDEDTLEQLVEYSEISRYRLKSTQFPIEKVKIPSFKGELGIHLHGTDTMARYARLLFEFGQYSGIGIKTSMGMGACNLIANRLIEKRRDENDG